MLEMQHIKKVYRTDLIETHALDDFSLQRAARASSWPSWAPRARARRRSSTWPACSTPSSGGTYLLDGEDVSRLGDDEMSRIRNQKIGFVFQSFNLIPDLDVSDNVDVPLRYRGLRGPERQRRIERALELVGLSSRARHLPSQLSGGQQQRVAIARVLAGDPRLILADEPTGNLDSLMTREIMDLLERINEQGTTIVMVTHSPECAAARAAPDPPARRQGGGPRRRPAARPRQPAPS